jgi:hypothetical protein
MAGQAPASVLPSPDELRGAHGIADDLFVGEPLGESADSWFPRCTLGA